MALRFKGFTGFSGLSRVCMGYCGVFGVFAAFKLDPDSQPTLRPQALGLEASPGLGFRV